MIDEAQKALEEAEALRKVHSNIDSHFICLIGLLS